MVKSLLCLLKDPHVTHSVAGIVGLVLAYVHWFLHSRWGKMAEKVVEADVLHCNPVDSPAAATMHTAEGEIKRVPFVDGTKEVKPKKSRPSHRRKSSK